MSSEKNEAKWIVIGILGWFAAMGAIGYFINSDKWEREKIEEEANRLEAEYKKACHELDFDKAMTIALDLEQFSSWKSIHAVHYVTRQEALYLLLQGDEESYNRMIVLFQQSSMRKDDIIEILQELEDTAKEMEGSFLLEKIQSLKESYKNKK